MHPARSTSSGASSGQLRRFLGTATLTLYGVGVIVGGGVYVLLGAIAARVAGATWMAFALAAAAALPTALSYASLSSRFPLAAGEAVFVDRAFARPAASYAVGFLVLTSGVASTAAVSHGFAGYFGDLFGVDPRWSPALVVAFLAALSWLNHRGIEEATWVNVVCTLVEVGALVVLVIAGAGQVQRASPGTFALPPEHGIGGLLGAAALAFYAFIGFEDICNVAEEVKRPHRTVPRAIILALVISTVIYVAVALVAVSVVGAADLGASDVPLVLLAERVLPGWSPSWLHIVAVVAVTNTALFNLIMASRILYGMGRQGWVPAVLARVHPARRTPTLGVVTAFVLAAILALTGALEVLAEATNVVILTVFFSVNLSLIVIHRRHIPAEGQGPPFRVPRVVPLLGMIATSYLALRFSSGAYLRAGILVALGLLLHLAHRWTRRRA